MNSDEKAVASVLARYEKALNESDTDAVMKLYASDGVFMAQNFPSSVGTSAVRKADATAAEEKAILCGLEITPACDYAQGKMGLSRIIAGFVVPWEMEKSIKNAAFLKRIGPFYFDDKRLKAGAYLICLNSRYVVGVELNLAKKLSATARVRAQLLGDVQSWGSYQAARQGVMMLG
jgi:hypothetical protein